MPVTAKLSKKFYDTFGDEIANELVAWFNAVDATYRGDLRELNELNFARFRAEIQKEVGQLRAEIQKELGQLRGEMHAGFGQLRAEMAAGRADVIKWMFAFWVPTTLAMIGLFLGVVLRS